MSKPVACGWLVLGMALGLLGVWMATPPRANASCSRLECSVTDCERTGPNSCQQYKYNQALCIYEGNGPTGNGVGDKFDGGVLLKNRKRPATCTAGGSCSATTFPAIGANCMPTTQQWGPEFNRKECCNDTGEPGCDGC